MPASLLSNRFLDYFAQLDDPRRCYGNKRHELSDVLVLTILAVISGAESWVEVEEFGHHKAAWLKQFLQLLNGIPSHDTLGRIFSRLNPEHLEGCFLNWAKSLIKINGKEVIAIDGKTLRRSYDGESSAIHMVSGWAAQNGLVLGQIKTEDKSNEITAIPALLQMIEVAGCTVTIDAMGCQRDIAEKILDKEGDYVLALKGNQKTLHDDVKLFFESNQSNHFKGIKYDYYETVEKGHGRIETRRYWITDAIDWFKKEHDWPGLQAIACVESLREIKDKVTCEQRYYIASLPGQAVPFAEAVRPTLGH